MMTDVIQQVDDSGGSKEAGLNAVPRFPEIRQFGDQLRFVLEVGSSLDELTTGAIEQLREVFSDVLEPDELDRRLADLKNARLVSAEEFERLSFGQEHGDGGACIIYQMDGETIRSVPLFAPHASRIDLINSVLHEGTHLAARPPHKTRDLLSDEHRYAKYLGPIRTEHDAETGKIDPMSIFCSIPEMNARVLFWEAVTDGIAMEESRVHFSEEGDEQAVLTSGYIEKHYIAWLLEQAPNRAELEKKMKKSYTNGDEHEFVWELGRQFNADGWQMYGELLEVLKEPISEENWEARLEAWQSVVTRT